ncbi:MAG: DUF4133 domain-containing protein [Dysgonamonadaceae bacterium]|jgi:hypothetical protein|nr:DUF4133 domain-containing protein [Dysgonamonadaceae bacterium]
MEYPINKGIGKPAEFNGLKAQYLFIFAGGLLGLFVVFVVMYMAGVNQWVCIVFGVTAALTLVYGTFHLNSKYGEHGLMKVQAKSNHPRYVISRRNFSRLFRVADPFKIKKLQE